MLPIAESTLQTLMTKLGITDLSKASIREIVRLVSMLETQTGERFIRMDMGIPGLPPPALAIEAEIEALRSGVASKYPPIEGIQALKDEGSRFLKSFLNVDISAEACVPCTGSMQGAMAAFLVGMKRDASRDTVLFINPGFPVQFQQVRMLGYRQQSLDVYNYRGEALRDKLEELFQSGRISVLLYSNPNNPAWFCLTRHELAIIAELANKYDVLVIEDLAYFGMDFREDVAQPGVPPFVPTIAQFTSNCLLLVSFSKSFSYAGQRIGMIAMPDRLFQACFPDLEKYFSSTCFGRAVIYGALYALSAGVAHSTQWAMAAMLKAVNGGSFDFVGPLREYGLRASLLKNAFLKNGFHLIYDNDEGKPLADGFYFTVGFRDLPGDQLLFTMLQFGLTAIPLSITGSNHTEGVRICVSLTNQEDCKEAAQRITTLATTLNAI